MKLISFAIPSYNSEDYLHHAVDSILTGGDEVEIIIINDGSTDHTAQIADAYAAKHPNCVKVVHKENGGHGSGVNRGLQEATGLYFKVVDSDDWVNVKALSDLLAVLRGHVVKGLAADLYFTNFVYDHTQDGTKFVRSWRKQFPVGRFFGWEDVGQFFGAQVLLMHSVLYRTEVLRESQVVLPEHTFYVDNYFAYKPLPFAKRLYYCDVDLYNYCIGRPGQSVSIENLTKRYDQQIRVMKCMIDSYSYRQLTAMKKGLRKYMLYCIGAIMMNTLMFCCSGGDSQDRKEAYAALWEHILERDPEMYRYLRTQGFPALVCYLPWKLRGAVMLAGYRYLCKTVKLG